MDAESEVQLETETQPTEEVVKTEETATEAETEPQYTEFEKKQHERAKLAEAENKRLKAELEIAKKKPQPSQDYTLKDSIAILGAQVHTDDVDRVAKFAKDEGITIAEALKNDELKAILGIRQEHRKSAEVANTSGSKRTSTKVTDEQLIQKAMEGKDVDPAALAEAEMNVKKAKFKR